MPRRTVRPHQAWKSGIRTRPNGFRPSLAGAAFLGLGILIALVPLPLGSARALAWDAMGLWTALLLVACVPVSMASDDWGHFFRDIAGPIILFAAVICFALLQVSGWTPREWHHPIWELAAPLLRRPIVGSIAVDPFAALMRSFRLLTYAGILFLALLLCRRPARAHAAIRLAALSGAAYAAYALIVYGLGNKTILWLAKWAYADDLTGPFVNRNSFATYLGLCSLAALAWLTVEFDNAHFTGGWRAKLAAAAELLSARAWLLVCLFLLVTAILLTHSRGGFIAVLSGMIAFVASRAMRPHKNRRLRFLALPVLLGLAAILISGETTIGRLEQGADADAQSRLTVYGLTWRAIEENPLLGTGLGSFDSVFPFFRTDDIRVHYDLAHNDYLENLLELGTPAAACLFCSILWLAALCVRGALVRRHDAALPCLGFAASVLVAVHALVDFSLQIPAVTAMYVFLLGAGVAQSRSSRRNGNPSATTVSD